MLLTPSPLSQTVTPSWTPPLERDVLHGWPLNLGCINLEIRPTITIRQIKLGVCYLFTLGYILVKIRPTS